MTLEKLAKRYRIPRRGPDLPHTHKGASHLIQLLIPANPINRRLHIALGKFNVQRRAYLNALLPTIHAIERLAPALAKNAQNAEYPWPLPNGVDIMAPFDHGFNEPALMQPKIIKVNELLRTIFQFLHQTGEW